MQKQGNRVVCGENLAFLGKCAACRGHDEEETMIVTPLGIERRVDWPWEDVSFLLLHISCRLICSGLGVYAVLCCVPIQHAWWLGTAYLAYRNTP